MKLVNTYIFYIIGFLAFGCGDLCAQTLTVNVDRHKIMIGEKILLTIKAEDVNPNANIIQWINLPDTINHFEVVERGKIDTIKVDGIVNYQQQINITSFDSGRWEIPPLNIKLNAANAPVLSTTPIPIEVLPVDVSHLKDYHDIKEIVEVQDENLRLIIILLIIVTILSIIILIWLIRKKRQGVITAPEPDGTLPPLQWALAELNKLKNEDLPSKGLIKQYYQRMTDISRQYFSRQLNHSVLHKTTDEWMFSLQDIPVEHNIKTSFFQFIRLADTVKFAKYLPPPVENEHSLEAAANMFNSVAALQFAGPSQVHQYSQR